MNLPPRITVRSIRLDEKSLEAMLDRLDGAGGRRSDDQRRATRYDFRVKACIILMQQPGDASPTAFLVPTRNISATGLGFLHGGFVHAGTRCMVKLISHRGACSDIPGTVTRCRYVEGRVHEVGVHFDAEIDPGVFCEGARGSRVLLADGDPTGARLLTCHLKHLGADVEYAQSGQQAIQRASLRPYDLILVDMDTPEVDGWEAVSRLRTEGYYGMIAALTTYAQPDDRERCLAAGCDDLLAKPVSREQLASLLDSLKEEPLISSYHGESSMTEFIEEFVASLPGKLRAFEEAMSRGDGLGLENLVRSLKGEAGAYGFEPIAELAGRVEASLTAGDELGTVRSMVGELVRMCILAHSSTHSLGPVMNNTGH